ncbi:LysM peptidoglycan-binding domain-containing protein [Tepidibacter thalassicus]|uniref:Spore germination protein n=1 Tax=Tepidibacter thalassicus DSM 15285 TaxID=1123350 RepID=A0A1M5RPI0_9FIRM|nr:LysM peptidoglycan-binding domain-containing protein [Tepidibacter thalassicus]SHH28162.1 spore germination protein [Tepidibacter thalassicus DSM 15285]
MEIYKVVKGDSLYNISKKYNIPIDEIVKANDLPYNDKLAVGMNLLIPSITKNSNKDYFNYKVKAGDFLYKIAKKFNINYKDIIDINKLKQPYVVYPGQIIKIPTKTKKKLVSTLPFFQPGTKYKNYYDYIKEIAQQLTYIAIFDIRTDKDGNLTSEIPEDLPKFILDNNITPLPVVTNFDGENFNKDLAKEVLTNNMDTLINNIVDLTVKQNYGGVILDFENLYPKDRYLFNNFVKKLSEKLHEKNKVLGMAIAPKWQDWSDRPWVGFFDYEELGKYLDIAYLMTYEWGWVGGDPQPIAPLPNMKKVIDYALTKMPNNIIYMGMNLYGYDWLIHKYKQETAKTVTLKNAYKLAIDNNVQILWNDKSKTPYFRYTDEKGDLHEVHFEDALSQLYKHELAKQLDLEGFGYWVLNTKIAPTWYILDELFKVRKVT